MSNDLIQTMGEIVDSLPLDEGLEHISAAVRGAGGLVIKEGGKLVAAGLVKTLWQRMFADFAKLKREGKIPEDFETSDRGRKLLQDALNAMSEGLDESQADTIRKVFLGLAMTTPADAMERVQQLSLLNAAANLTPWEVAALNFLERVSKKLLNEDTEKEYLAVSGQSRSNIVGLLHRNRGGFSKHLDDYTGDHADFKKALHEALLSLHDKDIIGHYHQGSCSNIKDAAFVYDRQHWLSPFGKKLVASLYKSEDALSQE